MKAMIVCSLAGLLLLSGAGMQLTYGNDDKSAKEVEAYVKAALAELSPSDRAAALREISRVVIGKMRERVCTRGKK